MKTLLSILLFVTSAAAQSTFYIDPPFTGGSRNGSSTNPWISLTDTGAQTAINNALATGNVTVYFSASQGQTAEFNLSRTDTSTHILTLNGTEKVNANDGINNNVTNWVAGVPLTPCTGYECAKNGAWIGHQYTVSYTGAGGAIDSNNNVNACQGYFDVRGFHFKGQGKIALLTYTHDITYEYNEGEATSGAAIGPGNYIGPGQSGPCNASTSNVGGPDNFTFQYNYTHNSYGECLYVGAETSDPPGFGSSEYTNNGMTCTSNCNTGAHYRILYNTNENCAFWGGQGDGTDIKDGHADLWFIGNTNRPSITSPAGQGGAMGMVTESSAIIDGNYFQDDGNDLCNGIRVADSWYNFAGRQDNLTIRNNIVTGFKSGACNNYGIVFTSPDLTGSLAFWTTPVSIYNNTMYNDNTSGYSCISVASSALDSNAVSIAQNNICSSTLGGKASVSSADYNDYFNAGVTCPVSGEPHSICTDPGFSSTTPPLTSTSFKTANVTGIGLNLFSTFTDDYGSPQGSSRPNSAFTIGAWEMSLGGTCAAPSYSPVGGTFGLAQSVKLTASCTTILYCTDTTNTCTPSTTYASAISVPTTHYVRSQASQSSFISSSVASQLYTIVPPAPAGWIFTERIEHEEHRLDSRPGTGGGNR